MSKNRIVLFILLIILFCITAVGSVSAANTTTTSVVTNSDNSGVLADSDWPSYHKDAHNTGQSSSKGPQTNNTKWSYLNQNLTVHGSPVIGSNGTIYVGGANGILYAFNPNGKLKWTLTTKSQIMGSPTIGNDGTIYFSNYKNTYAVRPNGTVLWKCVTGDYNSGSSPVIGKNKTVYVTVTNNIAGTLYAISNSGVIKWKYSMGQIYGTSPVIGPDGTIYMVDYKGRMYAINPNGTLKWSFKLSNNPNNPVYNINMVYDGLSIGADGTIYVANSLTNTISGNVSRNYFYLFAINDNGSHGSVQWVYTTNMKIHYIQEPVYGVPAISSDGRIYVVSASNLYAIDTNGNFIWCTSYDNRGVSGTGLTSAIIDANGTIYVGGRDGIFALNKNGTILWSYNTGEIVGSPALSSDGTLYVGTVVGTFYAFNSVGADFNMKWVSGTALTQRFTSNSTGAVKSWKWNFGDRTNSTLQNPTHIYSKSGIYTVTLTVTFNNGNNVQVTKIVNIIKKDITAPTVAANLTSGTYNKIQSVKLNAKDNSGYTTIYYTTDGTDPKNSATRHVYTNPIIIGDTTTLKFVAIDPSGNWSPTYSAKYVISVIYVKAASYYTHGSLSDQIQTILNNAAPGSTIVFLGSSYNNLNLVINKELFLVSTIGTTIHVSNPSGSAVFLIKGAKASGTKILGFKINTNTVPGILVSNTNNTTIYNNSISSKGSSAIKVINSTNTNIYENQLINSSTGINITNSDHSQITGNTISCNSKIGVFIDNSSNISLTKSQIKGNGNNNTAGIYSDEGGVYVLNSDHVNILNNDVTYNSQGITIRGVGDSSSYVLINTNKINENYGEGVLLSGLLKHITATWNYIQRNANGIQLDCSKGENIIVQSNNISSSVKNRLSEDSGNGISFGSNYQNGNEVIRYNVIYGNDNRYVSAHDASVDIVPLGLNVYGYYFSGDYPFSVDGNQDNFCCKIRTEAAKLVLEEVAPNVYVPEFVDKNNNSINNMLMSVPVSMSVNGNTVTATFLKMTTSLNIYSKNFPQGDDNPIFQSFTDDSGSNTNNNNPTTGKGTGGGGKNSSQGSSSSSHGHSANTGILAPVSAASTSSSSDVGSNSNSKAVPESSSINPETNSKIVHELFPDENKNLQAWSIIGIIILLIVVSIVYYRKEILNMLKKSKK